MTQIHRVRPSAPWSTIVLGLLVLLAPALAGCVGLPGAGPQGTDDADPGAASTPDYSDLDSPDADEVADDAVNGTRTFVFSGEVPPGYDPPFFGAVQVEDPPVFTFEVDASVGYVELVLHDLEHGWNLNAFLLDGEGRILCGATTYDDPDRCTSPVGPNAEDGAEWTIRVEAGETVTEPAAFTAKAVLHPPVHLPEPAHLARHLDRDLSFRLSDTGHESGEPTVGLTSDGTLFTVAETDVLRSTDDGETWEVVTPATSLFSFDPMLRVDPWTDRVILDHLYVGCSNMWWSDDQGETWLHNPAACGTPANDHQKVAVGGHFADSPVYDGIIYYSYNSFSLIAGDDASTLWVSRSLDGGVTWDSRPAVSGAADFHYRTGGPVEADRNGNVYVPMYLDDEGMGVAVSNDHGTTFDAVRVSDALGADGEGIDPGMAIDLAGNAYVAWWGAADGSLEDARAGAGHAVWLAASSDQGSSWGEPVRVSPPGLTSMVLVDAVAGDKGRVAVAYLAAGDTPRGPNRADGWATWHLYVSITTDALAEDPDDVVWHTAQVTPDGDPVQRGTICTSGIGCSGGNRNLLDFIDVQPGPDGRVYVSYTDGCTGDDVPCPTPPDSRDDRGFVAVQETGPRLFEDMAPWAE